MKNSIFKTVFTSLLIIFISCGNDDTGDDNVLSDDTFLTAKVDGVDFEVRGSLFAVSSTIGDLNSTIMGATYDDESKTINIGIANLNSIGAYTLIDVENDDPLTSSYASSLIYAEQDTGWYAIRLLSGVAGTITVTELNAGYVLGTFNFNGYDINSETEKVITEGRFKFKRLKVN